MLGEVLGSLWKCARNSVLPLAVPFRGESMHPEDVNPAATMPAVTLSMTFWWIFGSVTMPPALTYTYQHIVHIESEL